ncbi:MAG: ABC transporter permease [Herpetosiphonaceae bacterium]|nr:MAG: ABC transporter permease [Herpetosiphonaceae bacterium]
MKTSHLALLLLLALIWGTSFLFIKIGVETIPPPVFVGLRLALATIIIYGFLWIKQVALPRDWRTWVNLAILGLFNTAFPYTLFSWGEQSIPSGLAAIYNATTPLWTVILAQLWVREERLTPLRTAGVVLGFGGVVWLVSDDLQNVLSASFLGQMACIGASASCAIAVLFARRKLGRLPALTQVFGQICTGTLWLLPLILISTDVSTLRPSLDSLMALLALSILGTAVGLLLFFALLQRVGATRSAQVTYLLPIFGLFWGWLILGETIDSQMVGGLLVILLGVVAVSGRLPWRKQAKLSTTYAQRVDEQIFDSVRQKG